MLDIDRLKQQTALHNRLEELGIPRIFGRVKHGYIGTSVNKVFWPALLIFFPSSIYPVAGAILSATAWHDVAAPLGNDAVHFETPTPKGQSIHTTVLLVIKSSVVSSSNKKSSSNSDLTANTEPPLLGLPSASFHIDDSGTVFRSVKIY